MIDDSLRHVIEAQQARIVRLRSVDPPQLVPLIQRAVHPDEVRQALLRESPVLKHRRGLGTGRPDPVELREEAAAAGVLDATPTDLAYRRLFPALDLGVYAACHSTGKPSMVWEAALHEHLGGLSVHGLGVFSVGGWADIVERFRARIGELVGDDFGDGDVAHFGNLSDGLSTLLAGLPPGRLVSTEGHFTTGRYIHQHWASQPGASLVEVPCEEDGSVSLQRLVEILTPDTAVVSLSHGLWRSGFVQDVYTVAEAVMDVCPDAAFLLDAYQTLGTVPLQVGRLPIRSAVLAGGGKQLHGGMGAGFAWVSHALLEMLEPKRCGWWAHAEPLAFADAFVPGAGAARLRTGTPDPTPLLGLLVELDVFATSAGGSLAAALERARRVTLDQILAAERYARQLGLDVVGEWPDSARAAFLGLRVRGGDALVEALYAEGLFVDHRVDPRDPTMGTLRLSANAASFAYEVLYVVERVAELTR